MIISENNQFDKIDFDLCNKAFKKLTDIDPETP